MEAIHFLGQLILQDRRKLQTRITTAGNIYFELNVPRNHKKVLMNLTKKKFQIMLYMPGLYLIQYDSPAIFCVELIYAWKGRTVNTWMP